MFETGPILWLQSFRSEWLTAAMVVISQLGEPRVQVALALIVTFGIDLRLGCALFQMILWTDALAGLLKGVFALPRPAHVDSAVRLLGQNTTNVTAFSRHGGHHFFDLPDPAAIRSYRAQPHVSFGLPSRHVSVTTAFWGGLATLLKSRSLGFPGTLFVVAVALSRMYLGRHFLADVLGGIALGLFVVLTIRSFLRPTPQTSLLVMQGRIQLSRWRVPMALLLVLASLVLLLLILPLSSAIALASVGRLIGANVAFTFLFIRGMPSERTGKLHRLARVGLALILYVVARRAASWSVEQLGFPAMAWPELLRGMVPPLVFLIGTVQLGSLLGLYSTPPSGARRDPSRSA
jgi:membrane-associated phospholipid phosphatase